MNPMSVQNCWGPSGTRERPRRSVRSALTTTQHVRVGRRVASSHRERRGSASRRAQATVWSRTPSGAVVAGAVAGGGPGWSGAAQPARPSTARAAASNRVTPPVLLVSSTSWTRPVTGSRVDVCCKGHPTGRWSVNDGTDAAVLDPLQGQSLEDAGQVRGPEETLDYSYERTLEMLQKMRRAVADVATSRKRIELQAPAAAALGGQAGGPGQAGRLPGPRGPGQEALTRRQAIATQLTDLQAQHDQLKAEEARMVEASRRLQAKVDSFRIRKETMKANYTAAEAQTKVNEAISGIGEEMGDVGLAMQRAEDKVAQMQARSGALDELMASGALDDASMSSDRLQAELDREFAEPAVEAELARLKGELTGGAPPPSSSTPRTRPPPAGRRDPGAEAPAEEERR